MAGACGAVPRAVPRENGKRDGRVRPLMTFSIRLGNSCPHSFTSHTRYMYNDDPLRYAYENGRYS